MQLETVFLRSAVALKKRQIVFHKTILAVATLPEKISKVTARFLSRLSNVFVFQAAFVILFEASDGYSFEYKCKICFDSDTVYKQQHRRPEESKILDYPQTQYILHQ